jgi:hypothetical protein
VPLESLRLDHVELSFAIQLSSQLQVKIISTPPPPPPPPILKFNLLEIEDKDKVRSLTCT